MHSNFLPINKVLYYLILSLILANHKNSKASHDQAETATVASIKRSFNSRISLHCLKAEPILLNSSFLSPAAILGECLCLHHLHRSFGGGFGGGMLSGSGFRNSTSTGAEGATDLGSAASQ